MYACCLRLATKKKGFTMRNIRWINNKNFKQNSNAHISIKDEGRNPRKSDSRSRRQQQEAEWAESKRKYDEWCDEHTWKKYGHELLFMEPPVGMSCKRSQHTHTHTLTEACVHTLHGPPSEHECRFEWLSLLCDCQIVSNIGYNIYHRGM